jgi:hypothetical protein
MSKEHLDFLPFAPGPDISISLRNFPRNVSRLFMDLAIWADVDVALLITAPPKPAANARFFAAIAESYGRKPRSRGILALS